ncbi:MAG: CRISPR-associated protein Csx1 [Thermosipho sp. (in: thermotogales)]|nr:CRISPR-associated protein Csx1 [Thermosipho sp. (in: thermotogales)]MDK2901072.1 CRISPR-associated protein Csx1 [Thermosipho sp. (in: thermotogales)]
MRILFAIVGNLSFETYKTNKKYRLAFQNNSKFYESSIKLLSEHYNVDKVVIFVPDTLITTCKISEIPGSYSEINRILSNCYKERVKEVLKINDFELVVVPGIGTYKLNENQVTFKGEIKDLYNYTLYMLYKILGNKEFLDNENLEFIFDISLGLNYQQNIIYNVLIDLLRLLSYLKKTRIIIANSEPVIGNLKKEILNVHIIDDRKIFQGFHLYKIEKKKIIDVNPLLTKEEKKLIGLKYMKLIEKKVKEETNTNLDNFVKIIFYYLDSLIHGLPLVFLHLNKKLESDEIIKKAVELYLEAIEVEENVIIRKLKFGDFFKYIIFSELFRKYFNNLKFDYKINEIPFTVLEEVSKLIWGLGNNKSIGNNVFISLSLEKELWEIKESYEEFLKEGEEVIFSKRNVQKLKDNFEIDNFKNNTRFDPRRNYLAHSGLSEKTFKIKKKNGELFVSAIEEKIFENLKVIL